MVDYNKLTNQELIDKNDAISRDLGNKRKELFKLLDEMDEQYKEHMAILKVYDKRFNNG